MDFLPDADQDALSEATRQYVASRFPLSDSAPPDDTRWREIADLGWLGMATPEDAGGAGGTLLDEAFVFREIGRGLVPGPILATLAAARLAAWTTDTALARRLIDGEVRVARAISAADDGHALLLDGRGATLTLVVDQSRAAVYPTPQRVQWSPGLEDGTTLGHIDTADLGSPYAASTDPQTVGRLRRVLTILTAAQLAGVAAATRDAATTHAKTRVQFGKPIGAFQAIKHMCADMAVHAMAADSVMFFAALTETAHEHGGDEHCLAAAAYCRRAALANARSNIQIHGAMGFTVESSAHRFLKRTHTLCTTERFERAAELLGGMPGARIGEDQ